MVSAKGIGQTKKFKILVIRFSSIGDIVLTSPVLRCLHRQLGAEVHFLTKSSFSTLVVHNPNVYRVWELGNMKMLTKTLRDEQFDYVIDLHRNLRSTTLCMRLGVRRFTYDKTTFEKLLLIYLRINILPKTHVVDRYLNAVLPLGVKNDGAGLDFFFTPDTKPVNGLPSGPFIAAAIGATHFTKKLPTEKWLELIDQSSQVFVLIGGTLEKDAAEIIHNKFPKKIFNLVGKTSLQESALVLKQATVVVTNDTGMLHIAAALHRPIVSLWGGTIHEYGFRPYYPTDMDLNTSIEIINLPCRPCSKFGRHNCPKGHFKCMNDLNMIEAKTAITQKIQNQIKNTNNG